MRENTYTDKIVVDNPPGSPPRMRETLIFVASSPLLVRITPAYAGNTEVTVIRDGLT